MTIPIPSISEAAISKVIVVGAGPVGLFMALRLAQAGISVDIMEKDGAIHNSPRAVGYYGGTLQALSRAKVLWEAADMGFVSTGLCWRGPVVDDGNGGKRYGDIIARLPVPRGDQSSIVGRIPFLTLPQFKLAKIFFDEALATGLVTVHFNMQLAAIHDDGDSVKATFTRVETGTEETHQAAFLIGADGGKSTTRKLLKIPLKGHSWPERLLSIDCILETPLTVDTEFPTNFIIHPIHFGLVLPIEPFKPGKRSTYRCAVAIDPHDSRPDNEITSRESVNSLLDKMLPGPRPLNAEVLEVAPYRIHQLCASTFRRGRCALAGDAAHINNPFGGMGLCTGLLDAEALADSIDLIINEGKTLVLLDHYSYERQRVFQTFVNPVTTMNKLRCTADPDLANEDWLLQVLNTNPSSLEGSGRQYFDIWRTDMKALAAKVP